MTEPINLDEIRRGEYCGDVVMQLCDEVERLRADGHVVAGLPVDVLARFDRAVHDYGYKSRSEAIVNIVDEWVQRNG